MPDSVGHACARAQATLESASSQGALAWLGESLAGAVEREHGRPELSFVLGRLL